MKTPTIAMQIAAVKEQIGCLRRGYTDLIGSFKGKIRDPWARQQVEHLQAAIQTLRRTK